MSSLSSISSNVPESSEEQPAQFFLYTRPINDPVLGHADNVEFQHWVLIALFPDESIRAIEGNEADGVLTPKFLKEWPLPNSHSGKYWTLIPLKISPKKLQVVANDNSLNGTTYSLIYNNCQHWVKVAAETISSDLADSLDKYRTSDEVPIVEQAVLGTWASSKATSSNVFSSLLGIAKAGWDAIEQ